MTVPRSLVNSIRDSGWKKRKKTRANGLLEFLLWSAVLVIACAGVRAWEEGAGDDAVNVISVENMDALLGLRMVTELESFEGSKLNETLAALTKLAGEIRSEYGALGGGEGGEGGESSGDEKNATEIETRSRRMIYQKRKLFPLSSHAATLCSRMQCRCLKSRNKFLNVSCDFRDYEVVDMGPGSIPPFTHEIRVINAKHVNVSTGTFHNFPKLEKVVFENVKNLTIDGLAFQNLSTFSINLLIRDCQTVSLNDHAFRDLHNPLGVKIENCETVILNRNIFSWLISFQLVNVPNLVLMENSFSVEVKKDFELTPTMILFQNVSVNEIPNASFPLSAAKIMFVDCSIKTVRSGAFNAIALDSVQFERTRVERLESEAFSQRTLIEHVEFSGVDIQQVNFNALSAAARFTIQNSRIREISNGAFNINTAYLKILENDFRKIRRHAFEIHNWNSIQIEGNRFESLEPDFFSAPFSNITTIATEFTFSNNTLRGVEVGVLSFIPGELRSNATVLNNIFEDVCHCHMEAWIQERSGNLWEKFFETSSCLINDHLEKCYNISRGYMRMKDYMEELCTPENMIFCEGVNKMYRPSVVASFDLHNTERTVLGVIFLGVVCSIAIMLSILMLMWVREKKCCGQNRKSTPSNSGCALICSHWCNNGNLVTTNSISRINIHEYAEIQNQINHQQKQIILSVEDEGSDEEDVVVSENKATQTLPEELTQELIQSLREKLDNPDNYNEARDMIEHLYDLIKVEERCNNNNVTPRTSFLFDEDEELNGIYEVIQTKKPAQGVKNSKSKRKVDVVSTGTRVPSPDKLAPLTFNSNRPLPTIVNEYVEPRDRKSNEYCELPSANLIMPDVLASTQIKENKDLPKAHIYTEPVQNIVNRPLPNKPNEPGTSDS